MGIGWRIWNRLVLRPLYRMRFGSFGRRVSIRKPVCLRGVRYMHLGDRVIVKEQGWLEAHPVEPGGSCELIIGAGTSIGYFCQVYAAERVVIGENVLMGSGVFITDCTHGYEDVTVPVITQKARVVSPVEIGAGSWIGRGAVVIGAKIGRHCVVGANAVVTEDVPDYCVVAGAPARIIRRYDAEKGEWEKV